MTATGFISIRKESAIAGTMRSSYICSPWSRNSNSEIYGKKHRRSKIPGYVWKDGQLYMRQEISYSSGNGSAIRDFKMISLRWGTFENNVELHNAGDIIAGGIDRPKSHSPNGNGFLNYILRFSPGLLKASVRGIQSRNASTSRFQKRHSC